MNNNNIKYDNEFLLDFSDFLQYDEDSDDNTDNNSNTNVNFSPTSNKDKSLEKQITELKTKINQTNVNNDITDNEQNIINSCKSQPNLKQLIILNRKKRHKLQELRQQIYKLLEECYCNRLQLQKIDTIKVESDSKYALILNNSNKLGAPYFKISKHEFSPANDDIIKKQLNKELFIFDWKPPHRWLNTEIENLYGGVVCNFNVNKEKDLRQKLLNSENNSKVISKLETELNELKQQHKSRKIPEQFSNDFIDWKRISEFFLKSKHTPLECQSLWHCYLHPKINRNDWCERENEKIKTLTKTYSYQNWDLIAKQLGTNRTGFITCLHYYKNITSKFVKGKFTLDEDKLLLDLINCYKINKLIPWPKIVNYFENRSRVQLYHRYKYFLSTSNIKRGNKFTESEDVLLLILVRKFGNNFKRCSELMPQRTMIQLRNRYNSNLKCKIKKGTFTKSDDEIILNYVREFGEKQWSGLAEKLKRARGQVRQRYNFIKTFLKSNPKCKISDIPKRNHLELKKTEDIYGFLKEIADYFLENSTNIPTIEQIEDVIRNRRTQNNSINNDNNESVLVEQELVNYFKKPTTIPTVVSVQGILNIFGANLQIPNNSLDTFECLEKLESVETISLNSELLPPNLSSLLGLKNLLAEFRNNKKKFDKNKLIWNIEQNLLKLNEEERKNVINDREMFEKRFHMLFKWPSILSLEAPNMFQETRTQVNNRNVKKKQCDNKSEEKITKKRKRND